MPATHPQLTVTFNGKDEHVDYQPQASAESLLQHAKQAFDVQSNHLLSLFTESGIEIADGGSIQSAGILPGALLVLRQSTVRGGSEPRLRVLPNVMAETFDMLATCGAGRNECVVYWCSSKTRPTVAIEVVHPVHTTSPHGYEVDSGWVNAFFLELRTSGHIVVAQVHTHPGAAGHSDVDDAFALVPATGFLSLVLPDFALTEDLLSRAHLVTMGADGHWQELDAMRALAC